MLSWLKQYPSTMKNKLRTALLPVLALICNVALAQGWKAIIPLGGNAWVNEPARITDNGLMRWTDERSLPTVYFRLSVPQEVNLFLRLRVPDGTSKISVAIGKAVFTKQLNNRKFDTIAIGKVQIPVEGYVKVNLKAIGKTGSVYADITDLVVYGTKGDDDVEYVKQGSSFHFGRRGPSVHLRYTVPDAVKKDVRWFYNEITVPEGNDIIGSYFMADGFGEGYFGMQVNSPTERRILFSVWSPFNTQDPKSIPDSLKIKMLKKGTDVRGGEFGNEGSGGQSYKRFGWQAGKTYAFLLGAEPNAADRTTTYTAYFKDVAANKWYLIASFNRPQTNTYLTSLYSFLENFSPDEGNRTRMAQYGNQWISDSKGKWQELTTAGYTFDATAKAKYRKDYAGGLLNGQFYLKNCGFFDDFVPMGKQFSRVVKGVKPDVNLSALPVN